MYSVLDTVFGTLRHHISRTLLHLAVLGGSSEMKTDPCVTR